MYIANDEELLLRNAQFEEERAVRSKRREEDEDDEAETPGEEVCIVRYSSWVLAGCGLLLFLMICQSLCVIY